jgi:signal transduction histidine kinase
VSSRYRPSSTSGHRSCSEQAKQSRFLSSVSHELRTPLSSTLALCELLLGRADGPLREEQERQVKDIRAGAESPLTLVNDLLDLARIEAGKTTVDPKAFELDDLFSALRGMFRPLRHNNRVALVIESADDLGPIYTDESKVSQILRNLVSNALKFTEAGEVRVRARAERDKARIVFTVADTGIGIGLEDRTRIFDEFEQVEGPLQTGTNCTGLGLPVSRRLGALLGGELDVDSRPGAGSTFTLFLSPTRTRKTKPDSRPPKLDCRPRSHRGQHQTRPLLLSTTTSRRGTSRLTSCGRSGGTARAGCLALDLVGRANGQAPTNFQHSAANSV